VLEVGEQGVVVRKGVIARFGVDYPAHSGRRHGPRSPGAFLAVDVDSQYFVTLRSLPNGRFVSGNNQGFPSNDKGDGPSGRQTANRNQQASPGGLNETSTALVIRERLAL
jgi:hypothetical protein